MITTELLKTQTEYKQKTGEYDLEQFYHMKPYELEQTIKLLQREAKTAFILHATDEAIYLPMAPLDLMPIGMAGSGKTNVQKVLEMLKPFHEHEIKPYVMSDHIKGDATLAAKLKAMMDDGKLCPDKPILGKFDQTYNPVAGAYNIIDGIPRTVGQAQGLIERGIVPHKVIYINVPESVSAQRQWGRAIDTLLTKGIDGFRGDEKKVATRTNEWKANGPQTVVYLKQMRYGHEFIEIDTSNFTEHQGKFAIFSRLADHRHANYPAVWHAMMQGLGEIDRKVETAQSVYRQIQLQNAPRHIRDEMAYFQTRLDHLKKTGGEILPDTYR